MIDSSVIRNVMGAPVYDVSGDKIGTVGQVFVDTDQGHPVWASVNTGLFGTSETFVPLHDATWDGERLNIGYEKSFIKDAPRIDADGALSVEEQDGLYRYYYRDADTSDRDMSTRGTDDAVTRDDDMIRDDDMTRSDEEVRAGTGTRTVGTGRARLRKYVVTEEQTITVPVSREEVRVEWDETPDADVDDDSRTDGPAR